MHDWIYTKNKVFFSVNSFPSLSKKKKKKKKQEEEEGWQLVWSIYRTWVACWAYFAVHIFLKKRWIVIWVQLAYFLWTIFTLRLIQLPCCYWAGFFPGFLLSDGVKDPKRVCMNWGRKLPSFILFYFCIVACAFLSRCSSDGELRTWLQIARSSSRLQGFFFFLPSQQGLQYWKWHPNLESRT